MVIGAGLPRTGTSSIRLALSHLLDGPIHHMRSVLEGGRTETDFWNSAMEGKISTKQWVHFLEGRGYRGGVDFPTSAFYK